MSVRGIREEMKTRDLYLRMAKKGPYRSLGILKAKPVTRKEIEDAIAHDEEWKKSL